MPGARSWYFSAMARMERELETEPRLAGALAELIQREPIGAPGRRDGRAYVLDTLAERDRTPHDDPWETRDFPCVGS